MRFKSCKLGKKQAKGQERLLPTSALPLFSRVLGKDQSSEEAAWGAVPEGHSIICSCLFAQNHIHLP